METISSALATDLTKIGIRCYVRRPLPASGGFVTSPALVIAIDRDRRDAETLREICRAAGMRKPARQGIWHRTDYLSIAMWLDQVDYDREVDGVHGEDFGCSTIADPKLDAKIAPVLIRLVRSAAKVGYSPDGEWGAIALATALM